MVELLPCVHEGDFMIRVDELLTLADAGIEDADLAMRRMKLNPEYIEALKASNPRDWDSIFVTNTDRGHILYDGRHRREAIIEKKLKEIKATCQQFANEQELIEAAFEANLTHGQPLTFENRSDYVYVLHKHHPEWTQKQLAAKAHVAQSTVSEAIARRAKIEQEAKQPTQAGLPGGEKKAREEAAPDLELLEEEASAPSTRPTIITEEDRLRKEMQKTTKSMAREAFRLLSFIHFCALHVSSRKS